MCNTVGLLINKQGRTMAAAKKSMPAANMRCNEVNKLTDRERTWNDDFNQEPIAAPIVSGITEAMALIADVMCILR